jgi:DnaB-like helicase N terminal domain/AAA domain
MATPVPFGRARKPLEVEKPLPTNIPAERSVLGAILLDPAIPNRALAAAQEHLASTDFFNLPHQRIFQRMVAIAEGREAIDTLTLVDDLERSQLLDQVGGAAYVSSLIDGVPRVANVAHYARMVREKSIARQIIHTTHQVQQAALDGDTSNDYLLADLDTFARQASLARGKKLVAVDVLDFLVEDLPPLEYVLEPLLSVRGRGMVYSPRGGGKTYVTMQIAYSIAAGIEECFVWRIPKARPVVYIDGEMNAAMLQERQRLIARINGGRVPEKGMLTLITRDKQKDVRPKINTKEGRALIEAQLPPGALLILDNLSALSPSSDEQETEDWAQIEDWLGDLSWHGFSTLFVNHAGKSGDQRGTSKREDLLDCVLKLRVPSDHSPEQGLRAEIHITKIRGRKPTLREGAPFEVSLSAEPGGDPAFLLQRKLLKSRARKMLQDGMRPGDVALETGLTRWAVARLQRSIKDPAGVQADEDEAEV